MSQNMQCGGSNWLQVDITRDQRAHKQTRLNNMVWVLPVLLPSSGASNSNTIMTLCSVIK